MRTCVVCKSERDADGTCQECLRAYTARMNLWEAKPDRARPNVPLIDGHVLLCVVCDTIGVELGDVWNTRMRRERIMYARRAFVALAYDYTTLSYPQMAEVLHCRSHSSCVDSMRWYQCRATGQFLSELRAIRIRLTGETPSGILVA